MKDKLRILAASDFHGSKDIARKVSEKAKRERADLVLLAGDLSGFGGESSEVLEPFKKNKQKLAFIPGNWDAQEDIEIFRKFGRDINNYYISYGDVGILGVGNPDWKMEFGKEDLKLLEKNFKKMKSKKKILVSHLHASGTKAEFSGFKGDENLRKLVEEFKPDVLISAHIHEAEGIEDMIGKTKVLQVGRGGKLLEF